MSRIPTKKCVIIIIGTETFERNGKQALSPEGSSHPLHGRQPPDSCLHPKVRRFLLAGGRGQRPAQFYCSEETFKGAWIIGGILTNQPKDPTNVRGLLFRLIRLIKNSVDCRKVKDVIDFLVSSSQRGNVSPLKADYLKAFSIIVLYLQSCCPSRRAYYWNVWIFSVESTPRLIRAFIISFILVPPRSENSFVCSTYNNSVTYKSSLRWI